MFDNTHQSNKNKSQQSNSAQSNLDGLDINKSINFLPGKSKQAHKKILHLSKTKEKEMFYPDKSKVIQHKKKSLSFLVKLKSIINGKKEHQKNDFKKTDFSIKKTKTSVITDSKNNTASELVDQHKKKNISAIKKPIHIYSAHKVVTVSKSANIQNKSIDSTSLKGTQKIASSSSSNLLHQATQRNIDPEADSSFEVNLLPAKKKQFSTQQIFLSYLLAITICLLVTITPYVYFLTHNKSLAVGITSLEAQLEIIDTKNKKFNDQIILMKPFIIKLEPLSTLLDNHIYWSHLFPLLEQYTVGNVYYTELNIGDDDLITLTGMALDLRDLAEELVLLQQNSSFINVNLINFNFIEQKISSDPRIEFSLNFILSPEVIK